jgi:septal ring factor EnvC (AmiA/AmiB activator)
VSKPSLSNYKLLELFMTTFTRLVELVHASRAADQALIANYQAQITEKDAEIARLKSEDEVEDAGYEATIEELQAKKAELEAAAAEIQAGIDQLASEYQPEAPAPTPTEEPVPTEEPTPTDNSGETTPAEEPAPDVVVEEGGF